MTLYHFRIMRSVEYLNVGCDPHISRTVRKINFAFPKVYLVLLHLSEWRTYCRFNRVSSLSLKPRSHRPLRRLRRLTMGKFRWSRAIGGESCVIVRRCTTSQPSGVIARCIGSFCDVQKPGCDSRHRRVSYDNLTRSDEVTRRCTTSPHNIN